MLGDHSFANERALRPLLADEVGHQTFEAKPAEPWSTNRGDDGLFDLAVYWRLGLKHRFVIIGSLAAAVVIGAIFTLLSTPIYTAESTIQIDREAARVLAAEDVAPRENMMQGEEFFQTQYGLLRSRSLAERVIESLGLASSNASLETLGIDAPEPGGTAATQSSLRKAAVLETLQDNLSVSPVRGSRLVTVGYDNPNPVVAARIANGFTENFIPSNLDRKFESSSYARTFLEERIAQTKGRLESAERQLVAYAANQQIINISEPGESGETSRASQSLTSNNLVALNAALGEARAARVAAEERWRSARNASLMTLPEVLQNPAVQRLSEQRAILDASYQQKLSIYQPDYPEMMQLRAQIEQADEQIQNLYLKHILPRRRKKRCKQSGASAP